MATKRRPFCADAQAFLGFPGELPRVEEGLQLDLALVTCAPPIGPCAENSDKTIAECQAFAALLEEQGAKIVTQAEELEHEDARHKMIFGLQNLPDDASPDVLHVLYAAGVRVLALAYDKANRWGSGCLNLDIGLTEAGREAIRHMNGIGFILDLSHAGHRMAREALELIDRENLTIPVMASHGGCYSVYPHFRNLPDDVLIGIAKRGGVVGISHLTFILHRTDNSLGAFWEHLSYATMICGRDHVAVGSDAPHVDYTPEQEKELFEKMRGMIDPNGTWGARSPSYIPMGGHSRLGFLGCTEGVLGLNLLNFFKRSLS